MTLKQVTKLVVPFSEIPIDLTISSGHWILKFPKHAYVECHLDDDKTNLNKLDEWFLSTYPELTEEDSFFIHIDV